MFNAERGVLCRHRFLEIAQTASGKAGRHEKSADAARDPLRSKTEQKINGKTTGHIRFMGMLVGDFIADEGRDCASRDRSLLRLGAGGQQLEAEANPQCKYTGSKSARNRAEV